ncbi:hypothetical protein GFY24_31950 [Nocardia sp. SYP-A9097]|uniref:hypothetical protein n=1 Tax=Nocardia sp. SYP-A9097 TaxID=2663237 RepID=UPI00129BF669|nr:hypothetical protein [Nocardia sp. SYP-A9097]MRH91999.1 hypothetical protein [Nocardia sp. SYP-A9097]
MAVVVTAAGLSAGETIDFDGEPALIQSLAHRRTPKGDDVYDLELEVLCSSVSIGRSFRAGDKVELVAWRQNLSRWRQLSRRSRRSPIPTACCTS